MKTFLQTSFFSLLVTQICFAQWYLQTSGTTVNLNSVHFEDTNIGWTVGASGTILHTTNGGQEWLPQASGTINNLNEVWFTDLNTGWVVGDSGKILKTSNDGQEWIEQTSGTNFHLNSVCFTDLNKGWAVGGFYVTAVGQLTIILHTNNGGSAWVSQLIDTVAGTGNSINSVCFVDSSTGWADGGGVILKTIDGGNSWINPSPQYGWDDVSAVHFFNLYRGWISVYSLPMTHSWIMYTTNGGIDWLSGNAGCNANSIYFIDANNGWVVGHTSMGCFYNMFRSIDGGVNWISQPNVTNESLNSVYFTDINNGWAVGTNGTILHTTNGGVSFVEEEKIGEIPKEFLLSNNYPNPFNPSTKIKYSVPQSSNVVIKVFDVFGNEIETLVNEQKTSGTYEITWYAEQLPSGVYFYQLKAGSFVETKKMILLK